MAALETVALCTQCEEPQIGDVLTFSTADFDFCPVCARFTQTHRRVVLRLGDPINRIPSQDPSRQRDGGEYGYWDRVVLG